MIIDAHAHFDLNSIKKGGTVEDFQKNGVSMAVGFVMDLISERTPGKPGHWTRLNKEIAEVSRRTGGKVIPFCTVHPGDKDAALEEVRRGVTEDGIRGIKLQPYSGVYTACTDDMARLSEIAGELKVPIFFHCCFQPYVTPAQIAFLAKEFPDVVYILGHGGWNNEWPVAMTVAKRFDNIIVCTSGLNFGGIGEIVESCDNERIIFGSDFPCGGAHSEKYEIDKIREHHFGEVIENRIFCGNISRILDLEVFGNV